MKGVTTRGVTLIELLVVMSIIAVMAAMLGLVVPAVGSLMQEARAKADLQMLASVVELYRKDCNVYPDAINHNPRRGSEVTVIKPLQLVAVPPQEDGGTYPMSKDTSKSRPLYQTLYDEVLKMDMTYSELVWTLGTPQKGWANPQLFEVFKRKQVNAAGQLIDPFGRRFFYLSSVAYRNKSPASGAVAGTDGPFMNIGTYQIYSAGPNMTTYRDLDNKGGTDKDDITNWTSMVD
ncbi:MAG TPA: prepilin-type N-terminal cleavage/methylation domain-containing protein [Planctomycetota bacterium]|nr:prepilin-type N-terminal cleavage/methylation domain-containing protein [Planctomycetota bacterium]